MQAKGKASSGVWDAFCEEYHEGIVSFLGNFTTHEKKVLEQLPLTLQRAFILIRELDDQAQCEFSPSERLVPGLTNEKPTTWLWSNTYVSISKFVLTTVALGEGRRQLQVQGGSSLGLLQSLRRILAPPKKELTSHSLRATRSVRHPSPLPSR
jgi:hypothetical protein